MADLVAPRLAGSLSYVRFSDPFFNFGTGSISPNAAAASLEASYVVIGAGKLGALKSSRASLESAEASETATRFQSALLTDAAFFAVLAQRELARVAADRVRRAEEQLMVARVRVVAGEAIQSDSLQLVLELNRARFALLQRDSAVMVSRFQLGAGSDCPVRRRGAIDTSMPPELPFTEAQAVSGCVSGVPTSRLLGRTSGAPSPYWALSASGTSRRSRFRRRPGRMTVNSFHRHCADRNHPDLGVYVLGRWTAQLAVARLQSDRNVARARRDELRSSGARCWGLSRIWNSASGIGSGVGVTAAAGTYQVQRARYGGNTTIRAAGNRSR
jgi:hypothetical protein